MFERTSEATEGFFVSASVIAGRIRLGRTLAKALRFKRQEYLTSGSGRDPSSSVDRTNAPTASVLEYALSGLPAYSQWGFDISHDDSSVDAAKLQLLGIRHSG